MSRKHKRRHSKERHEPRPVPQDPSERKVEGGWDEESRKNDPSDRGWEARGDDVDRGV